MVQGSPAAARSVQPFCASPPASVSSESPLRVEGDSERLRMAKERPIPTMKICLNPKGLSIESVGIVAVFVLAVLAAFGLWLIFPH